MAKGFKKGTGGVNPINFRVIGGVTAPSSHRENIVWVNTDQKITSWFFSATEPTNPTEGMVWFVTSASSSSVFNALKKNGIQIYIIGAKQYISGAWETKEVKYSAGTGWVDVITYLYNRGDDCYSLTGGWEATNYKYQAGEVAATPSLSMGSSTMDITFTESIPGSNMTGIGWRRGSVWTKNLIDFTKISTIYITVDSFSDPATPNAEAVPYVYLVVTNTKQDVPAVAKSVQMSKSPTAVTYSLDVRDLTGNYYVALMNWNTYYATTLKISTISCE